MPDRFGRRRVINNDPSGNRSAGNSTIDSKAPLISRRPTFQGVINHLPLSEEPGSYRPSAHAGGSTRNTFERARTNIGRGRGTPAADYRLSRKYGAVSTSLPGVPEEHVARLVQVRRVGFDARLNRLGIKIIQDEVQINTGP